VTGAEVERTDRAIITPLTGEVVLLDSPTDALAHWLHEVRQAEASLRDAKTLVSRELLARMDREACWTVRAGGLKITGQAPGGVEYDPHEMRRQLAALVEADAISQRAMDEAIEEVVTLKVRAKGVNALRKLGGVVEQAVQRACRPKDAERRISLSEERST
jgi:hypothetical protein